MDHRHINGYAQNVGLKLHEKLIDRRPAIHPHHIDVHAGILSHDLQHGRTGLAG